jgi:UDPglucose--hexose-1-phosphate uridylyltransferase
MPEEKPSGQTKPDRNKNGERCHMKEIGFHKETTVGRYLNPFDGFEPKDMPIEERYDETTGVASRILPYRVRPAQKPDATAYLEKSPESICPFCPDLFDKLTPKFTPEMIGEGKFKNGKACLFPNAFPYDATNTVAIFSSRHFIPLDQLTPDEMRDGFAVCRDYFYRIAELRKGYQYCSINWNYMPPAGGGLIHPHLQTIVSVRPTNFMQRLLTSAQNYMAESDGGNLWRNLLVMEKEAGERFIASTGVIAWLAAFSPKGMAGEIDFYFKEKTSFFDLTETNFEEMLQGLSRVFLHLYVNNFMSFNLSLYATMTPEKNFWVQGKIVPRFEVNPLGTSDLNYFEKLHNEIICPVVPEQLCAELQGYFQE